MSAVLKVEARVAWARKWLWGRGNGEAGREGKEEDPRVEAHRVTGGPLF